MKKTRIENYKKLTLEHVLNFNKEVYAVLKNYNCIIYIDNSVLKVVYS